MDYKTVVSSIERGVVATVYLLVGEETLLRDRLISKFQQKLLPQEMADFNQDLLDGKEVTPDQIVNSASMLPFMSEKRLVIVQQTDIFKSRKKGKDNGAEGSEQDTVLLDYLANPSPSTCLILTTNETIDRRKKIFKAVEKVGQVVNLDPLRGKELTDWIVQQMHTLGKKATREAVEFLATSVGSHLLQLENEINKLVTFIGTRKEIQLVDVQQMVGKTAESTIFQLVDAVGEKKYVSALAILKEMIFLGEPPVKITVMIARQFRLILQAKVMYGLGYTEKQIASQMQVLPFVARKCIHQGKNFQEAELKQALGHLLELDLGIKTGQVDPVLGLELALVKLCA